MIISGRYGNLCILDGKEDFPVTNWNCNYVKKDSRYVSSGRGNRTHYDLSYPAGTLSCNINSVIPPLYIFDNTPIDFQGIHGAESPSILSSTTVISNIYLRSAILNWRWDARGKISLNTLLSFIFKSPVLNYPPISTLAPTDYEEKKTVFTTLVYLYYSDANGTPQPFPIILDNYAIRSMQLSFNYVRDLRVTSYSSYYYNSGLSDYPILHTQLIIDIESTEGITYLSNLTELDYTNYFIRITVGGGKYWDIAFINLVEVRNIEVNIATGEIIRASFVFEQGNSMYDDSVGFITYPDVSYTQIYPWQSVQ